MFEFRLLLRKIIIIMYVKIKKEFKVLYVAFIESRTVIKAKERGAVIEMRHNEEFE